MTIFEPFFNFDRCQQGAALIVSLLLLLVMTLLGVTAMQSNLLQEKMAGNFHDTNIAFQAAEAGLRDGETDVSSRVAGLTGFNASCDNGLCDATAGFNPVWSDPTLYGPGITYGTHTSANTIANVSCQPKYWIEGFKAKVDGGQWEDRYRITVIACGGSANSQATLQSVFKP